MISRKDVLYKIEDFFTGGTALSKQDVALIDELRKKLEDNSQTISMSIVDNIQNNPKFRDMGGMLWELYVQENRYFQLEAAQQIDSLLLKKKNDAAANFDPNARVVFSGWQKALKELKDRLETTVVSQDSYKKALNEIEKKYHLNRSEFSQLFTSLRQINVDAPVFFSILENGGLRFSNREGYERLLQQPGVDAELRGQLFAAAMSDFESAKAILKNETFAKMFASSQLAKIISEHRGHFQLEDINPNLHSSESALAIHMQSQIDLFLKPTGYTLASLYSKAPENFPKSGTLREAIKVALPEMSQESKDHRVADNNAEVQRPPSPIFQKLKQQFFGGNGGLVEQAKNMARKGDSPYITLGIEPKQNITKRAILSAYALKAINAPKDELKKLERARDILLDSDARKAFDNAVQNPQQQLRK